ncbi:MAG: chromosome partitioning protein ParA [Cyanobacteria bacterium]|nr:chromosome partitioning protein ParA [Cyanobacteriota bacterium]
MDFDFTSSEDTHTLWEEIISGWRQAKLPEGKRFLGSLVIEKERSNQLLRIVGENLRFHLKQEGNITYSSLCTSFDARQNWIKIITAALSEYAYYYSSSEQGFWEGFCNCQFIRIRYSQGVANTLREISRQGSNLLGLVKANRRSGIAHAATLWLQSGIPQKNLNHFAELVQNIVNDYGWWELAHTSEKLLSQELLDFCQEKHPQWGILIGFLKISCSDIETVEPISGQLVQGIASVALELERNHESPEILRDANQRESRLSNYYLPKYFFLRDWDNLIQVLSHTQTSRNPSRKTIKPRKKPLSILLDVFDTGNIQLVLPEQNLREPKWSAMLGRYCRILNPLSVIVWEGQIPSSVSGFLEIPERIIDVKSGENQWRLRLLAHDNSELANWSQEGITDALPCLIFDANIGTHISLDATNPVISRTNEIICFIPKDVKLKLNNEIDILSSYVPCSISDWYGQHIQLLSHTSEIILIRSGQYPPATIKWQISDNQQPVLRGLKIQGEKEVYLEAPTLWHPLTSQNLSFNISVENLTSQEITASTSVEILASDRWQSISIEQMITVSGKYQVRFWNEDHRYSYNFELKSKSQYLMSEASSFADLQVFNVQGDTVESLPIPCDRLEKFWAKTITIRGFWTLEKVTLTLSNGESKISRVIYADKFGAIVISLATLHGKLPDSDWYALDFQRSGRETQRLVELVSNQPISCTWDNQAIYLSGLQLNQNYSLICWNLLTPHHEPEKIRMKNHEQDTIAVCLSLNAGIYHIQIQGRSLQDLGCWCGSNKYESIPYLAEPDEDLEKYCYTIIDCESTENFIVASKKLAINRQRIKSMLSSLQLNPCIFPDWLNQVALQEKLEAFFLKSSPPPELILETTTLPLPPPPTPVVENWYLIRVAPYRRETFHTLLKSKLHSNEFKVLILEIGVPQDSVYQDHMLVRSPSFKNARSILSQIAGFQKIEHKQLTADEVNRMLGRK